MIIKNADGSHFDVASKGLGGTALGFGIGGAALGLLNGGLGNLFGGGMRPNGGMDYVSKETFILAQSNAAKDAEISLLKAVQDTDKKLVDVYSIINDKVSVVREEMLHRFENQAQVNAAQAVLNGGVNSTIACLQGQVNQLYGLTKMVIPNDHVCPGWGTATVSVSTGTTTA